MIQLVDQTTFGNPLGNCFAACVASLLGLPVKEVPNFCYLYEDAEWYDEFLKWLKPRGWAALTQEFGADPEGLFAWIDRCAPGIPYIAGGPTSRGMHCVLYLGRVLLHDPNPHARKSDRVGLDSVHDATFLLPDFGVQALLALRAEVTRTLNES